MIFYKRRLIVHEARQFIARHLRGLTNAGRGNRVRHEWLDLVRDQSAPLQMVLLHHFPDVFHSPTEARHEWQRLARDDIGAYRIDPSLVHISAFER